MTLRSLAAIALALSLLAAGPVGCVKLPRMLGGSGDVTLVLDGEQVHATALPRGCSLTLDMRDPGQSGYVFAGTAFDTDQLRLDGIESRPGARTRYTFTALAAGESEIQIKIKKPDPGYRADVFKRVRVRVE